MFFKTLARRCCGKISHHILFFFLKKHEINRTVGKREGCGLVNGLRGVDLHRWYTSLGWGWLPATIQQHFLTPSAPLPYHLTLVVGFRTGSLPFALSDDTLAVNHSLRVQYHLSSLASTWSHIQDDYFSFRHPQLWGFGMPTSIFLTYPPHTVLSMVHSPPIPLLQHISFVSTWKIPVDCWTVITKDHW